MGGVFAAELAAVLPLNSNQAAQLYALARGQPQFSATVARRQPSFAALLIKRLLLRVAAA